MNLPAFFGHKKSINLLPRDSFEDTTLGIILEWALVFGKWTVIFTQLVVMGAFLYRFTLDRQLTDLRKSIAKDVAVIKSYEQVERDYILAQKQLEKIKTSIDTQDKVLKAIDQVSKITPGDVWFDKITISKESVSLSAYAGSLGGFGQFLTGMQQNKSFANINLSNLETSSTKGAKVQFEISAKMGSEK